MAVLAFWPWLGRNSSEVASALMSPKNVAKLARAQENSSYVISANTAGLYGSGLPAMSGDGSSKIVDHRGLVLAEAAQYASMAANAQGSAVVAVARPSGAAAMAGAPAARPQRWQNLAPGVRAVRHPAHTAPFTGAPHCAQN